MKGLLVSCQHTISFLKQGFSSNKQFRMVKKIGNISLRWYLTICSQKPRRKILIWKNYSKFFFYDNFLKRFLGPIWLQKTFFSIQYVNTVQFRKTVGENMCVLSLKNKEMMKKKKNHEGEKKLYFHPKKREIFSYISAHWCSHSFFPFWTANICHELKPCFKQ